MQNYMRKIIRALQDSTKDVLNFNVTLDFNVGKEN